MQGRETALTSATLLLHLIKIGTVAFGGSTGTVLEKGMKRIADLIDRTSINVRLSAATKISPEERWLLQIVDQIPQDLLVITDQQLFYSALLNLVKNAMK